MCSRLSGYCGHTVVCERRVHWNNMEYWNNYVTSLIIINKVVTSCKSLLQTCWQLVGNLRAYHKNKPRVIKNSWVSLGYFAVNLSGGQPKMYWWLCCTGVKKSHKIAHICCQTQGQHIRRKTISLRWLCIDLELTPSAIMTSRETQEFSECILGLLFLNKDDSFRYCTRLNVPILVNEVHHTFIASRNCRFFSCI